VATLILLPPGRTTRQDEAIDVVCCSLDPWDDVWRRNQFLASELLRQNSTLRILFVELPVDVTWSLAKGRWPDLPHLRAIGDSGRLWTFAPRKWLPRRVWPFVDRSLGDQVQRAARRLQFRDPVLWVNDNTYADLAVRTGWPSVYDVTDDWLLGAYSPAENLRQRANDATMVSEADEIVVCSPALAISRGQERPVHLVPNGVDVDHLRRPQPRPDDLPPGPLVLYTGSLSEGRLDVDLCVELACRLGDRATLVLVGPNSFNAAVTDRLTQAGALLVGARPYQQIPAYMQHADVFVVPHSVNPFTESLDPIKAREALAVGRPTVSTPVSGFRDLGPPVTVASRQDFVGEVLTILDGGSMVPGPGPLGTTPPSWEDRGAEFLAIIAAARDRRSPPLQAISSGTSGDGSLSPPMLDAAAARSRPAEVRGSPPIEIVIIAYGDPTYLHRCLEGLGGRFAVTVVDNSSNAAVETLVLAHAGRYLDPKRNLGFAAGVNLALESRTFPSSDVLLLNPDATIGADDIMRLQQALRASSDIAAAAPTQRPTPDGAADRVCWPFPSPLRIWLEAIGLGRWPRRCDFVIGSVLLLRNEALRDIGGFDERFFLYAEETDWQRRARRRGWRVALCTKAEAYHVGAATDTDSARREVRFHAGTERYIRKWYGATGWTVYRIGAATGAGLRAGLRSGPARARAVTRSVLYLRGPDRVARRSGMVPAPQPRIPTLR
jgi:teichuronic acid biosynthesis glycosyltransferase TuaH